MTATILVEMEVDNLYDLEALADDVLAELQQAGFSAVDARPWDRQSPFVEPKINPLFPVAEGVGFPL